MPLQQQTIYPRDAHLASRFAKWFFLGAQNSGDLANLIPGKAQAVKHPSFNDATAWAAPGLFTVGGAGTAYASIEAATADLESLAYCSLIVACRIKKTAVALPAAERYLFSSYQPGSGFGGIVLASRADGSARLYINTTDNTTVSLTTAANTITNGSAAPERTYVFIVPREGGNGFIGVDGLETVSATVAAIAGKAIAGGRTARLGVDLAGVAADSHGLGSFQAYSVPVAGSAINRLAVYDWVQRNPHLPIPDSVFGL